jgi:predicted small integral membrane protein
MDAKFLFWCGALTNMAVMFGLMCNGVRQIRRGNVQAHKRSMIGATTLVFLFLLAYAFKATLLGKEDFSLWSQAHVWNLRFHETCVLVMLLAGGFAMLRARRLRETRNVTKERGDPMAPESLVRSHTRAGWTAVSSATLGLLTAAIILAGMYGRL